MLKTFSMDVENVQWIEESAKSCGTKASTYLNQIVRHARGDMSMFGPPGKLKEKVENYTREVTTEMKTKTETKIDKWLATFLINLRSKGPYERADFIRLQSGVSEDILGEEITEEFLTKLAKEKGIKLE